MKKKLRSAFLLESLEARLLFSADLVPVPVDGGNFGAENECDLEISLQPDNGGVQAADTDKQDRREVVFVDEAVDEVDQLIADLESQRKNGRQLDIVALDSDHDGIAQISAYLNQQQSVDAVHILSHGTDGEVFLGNSRLNATTLDSYAEAIEGWQRSLTGDADLLFYGCNVAASDDGQDLVNSLTLLTGADVAASDDVTGSAQFGGDWVLEYGKGEIETAVAISSEVQQNWNRVLAVNVLIVDTTSDSADAPDASTIANLLSDVGADGKISLREAIMATNGTANLAGGADRIHFQITDVLVGGAHTITVGNGGLPVIRDAVVIDGTTDTDYSGSPIIELDGSTAGGGTDGLVIGNGTGLGLGSGSTIRGLVINRFNDIGIWLNVANDVTIEGNFIGTDVTGTLDRGNGVDGIDVENSERTQIGGTTSAARNIISWNTQDGIWLHDGTNDTVIEGNYIGTDVSGLNPAGNRLSGIRIFGNSSDNNRIGGAAPGAGNLISGNLEEGIILEIADSTEIYGNLIGTDARGMSGIGIGNGGSGIHIWWSSNDNSIGGTNPGEANVIAFNGLDGIHIETDRNTIRANVIFGNTALNEIHLTLPDNPPTVLAATSSVGITTVTISISGGGNPYEVDLFSNSTNVREGQVYLGSVTVTGNGNPQDVVLNTEVAHNHYITATATSTVGVGAPETSEFSGTRIVTNPVSVNTAPVLDPSINVALNPYLENAGPPVGVVGTLVRDLVDLQGGGKDNLTDPDVGAVAGIAVISADTSNGTWHYSTDNGVNWFALGAVSIDSARLLAANDANTRIYFQPNPAFSGSIPDAIYFRAWDQTDPNTNGTALVDTTIHGGTTAFSLMFDSASIMVMVNNEPTLTTTGSDPTFTEGGAAAGLFSGTSVGTVESSQTITGLTLTVTNVSDGANEILNVDGSAIALTNGNSGATASLSYSVSVSAGTATVTLSGGTLTTAATQTLVDAISYQNNSADPNTSNRVVTLTELVDSGGTANGGDDTATLSEASTVTVQTVNDEPTLTTTGSDPTFTEGGAAAGLFSGTSVGTVESSQTITGLTLTVTNVSDGANEILNVDGSAIALTNGNSGATASLSYSVSVSAGTATVTLSGGTLTTAATQTLVDAISYQNNSADPNTSNRVVTLTELVDSGGTANGGDDTATLSEASTVTVQTVNDEPTLTTTGSDPTFTEGGAAAGLFSGTSVGTVESSQTITGLTLTVTNVSDGANEILNVDGSAIALTNGNSGATASLSYSVSVSAGTATVTLSGGTLTTAATQTLVDAISYQNNSADPNTSNRVVTLTELVDSGGTANGGDDTATLSEASTVTVQTVNDEPTLTTTGSDPTFTEGGAAAGLFSGTSVGTVESSQTITGLTLTVTNVSDGANEILNVDGSAIALTNGNSGATASLSYSVSVSAGTATVTLSGGTLTTAATQTLVDAISYQNNSADPNTSNRVVTLTELVDSGGTANGGDDTATLSEASTVTVQTVNDEPTLTTTGSDPTFTEGGAAAGLFSGTSVGTVESSQTITGLTLTVTNVSDGANEILNVDGSAIALTNGNSGATASLSYSVSVSAGTATVTLSGGTLTTAATQTLVDAISYQNNSADPNTSNRVVTLTELVDSGGTANGGDDTATLSEASTVTVQTVNDEPTLTTTGSDPTFTEGGAAAGLFSGTSVGTVESSQTITGLTLTVTNVSDGANEILNVDGSAIALTNGNSGATASLSYSVSVSAGTATVTLSGGTLTTAATQTLVDAISYQNNSADPNTSNRVVTLTELVDSGGTANGGDDTATLSEASTVTVQTVNDEPTLTTTGSDPTFTEGGAAAGLFSGTSVGTVESSQTITGLTLTVTNVSDGANEILNVDGSAIALTNGNSGATASLSYSVSVSAGTATVTLSGGTLTTAATQTLVDAISYQNNSADPNTSNRVVTLTELVDSGGTANGGDDTATLSEASTVTVQTVNDEPTLTTTGSDPTFTEGGAAAGLFSGTSVGTVESSQTITGLTLTVTNVSDGANEILNVDGSAIALTNGNSGATASLSYSVSVSAGTATVTLSGGTLTTAATQTLVDAISYQNNSADPNTSNRVVTLTELVDSGGTANGGDDTATLSEASTVTVQTVNDEPTLTTTGSDPTFTEGGAAAGLFSGTSVGTVESSQTITGLTLTVTNVSDGANEILNVDGSAIALTNGNSGATASLSYSVSVSAGTATVTLSGGTLTTAATQTLVDAISYQNNSADPNTSNRVVTLTELVDSGGTANGGDDTATLSEASTVTVQTVNDEPTLTTTGSDPTFTESGAAAGLFSATSVGTVESGQTLTGLTLTVTNVSDGANEILNVDGSSIALTDSNSGSTATNSLTYNVSVTGTTATVTLTGGTMSTAATQTLVDGLSYQNDSNDPNTSNRVVTLTQLVDSGGIANGGDNTATLSGVASTVTVQSVNDPGTVTIDNTTPTQGDTLTANVIDPEGASGVISYQWFSDGVAIMGATGKTYTTNQADVGTVIAVTTNYTDDQGTAESLSSAGTSAVTNVNDPGSITIDNITPAQGDTLTAGVTDIDGASGAISYQWFSDGIAIGGAASDTYTTTQADVGTVITVTANYTDDLGTVESLTSAPTAAVTNVNDTPVAVDDNLNATEDQPIAFASITDLLANDSDIDGDALTLAGFSQPANGMLVENGDGTLTYTPAGNFYGTDSFSYTINDGNGGTASGSAIIVVAPVGDTPHATNVTTNAETHSELIYINRNAGDGAEVSHFKISGITNGTLYLADGVNRIDDGDFITVSQGQAGLKFTPAVGSTADGSFNIESSEDGVSVSSQSGMATSTITVMAPASALPPTAPQGPRLPEPENIINEEVVEEETEEVEDLADETETPAEADNTFTVETPQPAKAPVKAKPSFNPAIASFSRGNLDRDDDTSDSSTGLSPQTLKKLIKAVNLGELKTVMKKLNITTLPPETYDLVRSSLDAVKEEIGKEMMLDRAVLGSAIATSVGLSAGYVVWMLKGGSLLASVLSSLPAWQLADPLAILVGKKDEEDDEDDDSLKTIIEEGSGRDDEEQDETSKSDNPKKESLKR